MGLITVYSDEPRVRRQIVSLEPLYGLTWRRVLRLLVALAYHDPPDLTWLVAEALDAAERGGQAGDYGDVGERLPHQVLKERDT